MFKWKRLRRILRSIIIQGRVIEMQRLYKEIFSIHRDEFTEDNELTLKLFMLESINDAFPEIKTKEEAPKGLEYTLFELEEKDDDQPYIKVFKEKLKWAILNDLGNWVTDNYESNSSATYITNTYYISPIYANYRFKLCRNGFWTCYAVLHNDEEAGEYVYMGDAAFTSPIVDLVSEAIIKKNEKEKNQRLNKMICEGSGTESEINGGPVEYTEGIGRGIGPEKPAMEYNLEKI